MKIGKLNVKMVSTTGMGQHVTISSSNTDLKAFFVIEDDTVKLNISKQTAKLLAKWIRENVR